MKFLKNRVLMLSCLLVSACAARGPEIHGVPEIAVPCAIEEGDLDFHTLLESCLYARERYEVLRDREPAPVTVVVRDTTAITVGILGGRVVLEQPSRAAMSRASRVFSQETVEGMGEPTWHLPHELAHMLLIAETPGDEDGYGSILPDWADEGVAIWAESETKRAERMRQASELDDVTLDLLTFTTLRHPGSGRRDFQHMFVRTSVFSCPQSPCEFSPVGRDTFRIVSVIDVQGASHVDTVFPGDPAFNTVDVETFYAVASTILPFFHERGGPPLVNELFERMLAGSTGAELLTNLPGMPSDPAEVNRQWRAFVRAAPPTARSP